MKLQVLQESLSKALNVASRFSSQKVQLPVLANVLLSANKNKLTISSTNLEVSVSLPVGAKTESEGEITIPAKTLTEIISNLNPGQLILESEKEQLKIKTSDFESVVVGMNASDFPVIPKSLDGKILTLPKLEFVKALSEVLFSVSVDETRPILTGVLMIFKNNELTLVSTDGFRLSHRRIIMTGSAEENTVILPKNVLTEIARLGVDDDNIRFVYNKGESQVVIGISDWVISSRTIEGDFPDFDKIIPKSSKIRIEVERGELLRAVKLASVFARDSANVIKLKVSGKGMDITAESSRSGSQKNSLDTKVTGIEKEEDFYIAFNYKYIEDFLNTIKGDVVEIGFNDANAPGVFLDIKEKSYLHIIMPVRIQD